MIDVDGDDKVIIQEFRDAIKGLGEFENKEIFTLSKIFDEDNNGEISEQEFYDQLKAL